MYSLFCALCLSGDDVNVNLSADLGRGKKVTDSAFGTPIICYCCQKNPSERILAVTSALGLLSDVVCTSVLSEGRPSTLLVIYRALATEELLCF